MIQPTGCQILLSPNDATSSVLVVGASYTRSWTVEAVGPGEPLPSGEWRTAALTVGDMVALKPDVVPAQKGLILGDGSTWSGGDLLPDGWALVQDFEVAFVVSDDE